MAVEAEDHASVNAITHDLRKLEADVAKLEFRRMFSGEMDPANAFVEITSGAGGTEAQDWCGMLYRMYLRWCEGRGFKTEIIEESYGEVAGMKSATFRVEGSYAPSLPNLLGDRHDTGLLGLALGVVVTR